MEMIFARIGEPFLNRTHFDPVAAHRAVTEKTRAIIVPHLFGLAADLTALERLGVPLIEDCAQTLGVMESGRPIGTVGRLTVCSFYATKLLCADPLSRGSWPMPQTMESQIWESAGITPLPYAHAMYEVSTNRLLRAKGWARISEKPARYLWLSLTRAFDFWIGNSFYLVSSEQGFMQGLAVDAADRGWPVAVYSVAKRLLLIPGLVVLTLWSTWYHRSRWRELLPLYVFPIGLMLGYIPFTVEAGRYALPVLPC